ncbi:MAG: sugar phosphate isomerase/epimerase [Chloroflexi bacterium]|nr:sugar phosphate isomerase/epimerase [Chloroflexota bacterium]
MKLGFCTNLCPFSNALMDPAFTDSDAAEFRENLKAIKAAGYDFVEYPVGLLRPEKETSELRLLQVHSLDQELVPEVFNCFIPPTLKVVGNNVNTAKIEAYVKVALERVKKLGAKLVVFGSGAARRTDDDVPHSTVRKQLVDFLRLCGDCARQHGLAIVVEPLNRQETNVINSLSEAGSLVREVNMKEIGIVADLHHMEVEKEPLSVLKSVSEYVWHAHIADSDRLVPGSGSYDCRGFFRMLREIRYAGRMSVECIVSDFGIEIDSAAKFLRRLSTEVDLP